MENMETKLENETCGAEKTLDGLKKTMKHKMIMFGIIVVVVLAGALLFYFFYFGNASRQAVAQVNGEKITVEQFNEELGKVEDPLREMYKEEPHQFLEGIIIKRLLLQEAKKQNLVPPIKTYKDTGKDSLQSEEALITELMKKMFSSPPEVTREEVEAFYTMFRDRMEQKPLSRVAPIIEQIIREAKQKEALGEFIEDLRKNAKVEIDEGRLQKIALKPPESNTEDDFKKAISSGKPVLVDFGANSCLPCRQMRPILKEVDKEYSGKAHVLVIDVYKYQNLAEEYKVQLIPTLVFFDAKGKEVFRHIGVLDKEKIVAKLEDIGVGI